MEMSAYNCASVIVEAALVGPGAGASAGWKVRKPTTRTAMAAKAPAVRQNMWGAAGLAMRAMTA